MVVQASLLVDSLTMWTLLCSRGKVSAPRTTELFRDPHLIIISCFSTQREDATCRVEIEPAIDLHEEWEKVDGRLSQADKEPKSYTPDYSCHGDLDALGGFFSEYHDAPWSEIASNLNRS